MPTFNLRDRPILFLQENILYKLPALFLLIGGILAGCASTGRQSEETNTELTTTQNLQGTFALPQQKAPPKDIQSIQLHPQGKAGRAPIISLQTSQKLILSFDYLDTQSRQFYVKLSHRSQNWDPSGISPSTYLDSFSRAFIQESVSSYSKHPAYRHVSFSFPNNEIHPVVSGNYLLEVYSYEDKLLFSMPFFITEDRGSLTSRIERLYAQQRDGRSLHQPFFTYRIPPIVEYPQFDLSASFAPNQFWGQMQKTDYTDTITPGELSGHLSRNHSFIGNYELKYLDLRSFDPDGRQILEYNPAQTPPEIILRRDIQNLDTNPRFSAISEMGLPGNNRNSNYARVRFSLETERNISAKSEIYLVGDFNNWMINELNKMGFDSTKSLWTGQAFIKQGQYAYKYVLVTENGIEDLALDQGFLSPTQEYFTFIYFKDPERHYDRLLKVDRLIVN